MSFDNKITTLRSFDLVNTFPTKNLELKRNGKLEIFVACDAPSVAKEINKFITTNKEKLLGISTDDLSTIKNKLALLNSKVDQQTHIYLVSSMRLIDNLILEKNNKKHTNNPASQTTSSSYRALPAIPKKEKANPSAEATKEKARALPKTPPSRNPKEKLLEDIQRDLQALDSNPAVNNSAKINALLAKLVEAKKKYPELSPMLGKIDIALMALTYPVAAFGDVEIEEMIMTELTSNYKKDDLLLKLSNSQASSSLIKFLKTTKLSVLTKDNVIENKIKSLKNEAFTSRAKNFTFNDPSFNNNDGKLIKLFENLISQERIYGDYIQNKIDLIYKKYDNQSQGRFSKLIANYHSDLHQVKGPLIKLSLSYYLKACTTNEKFDFEFFKSFVDIGFDLNLSKLTWFFENLSFIKKTYNQAFDPNCNTGKGICYQISCNQISIIINNPKISSEKIEMQSTQEGRFVKACINKTWNEETKKMALEYSIKNGLSRNEIGLEPPKKQSDSRQYVIDQLFHNKQMPNSVNGLFSLKMRNDESGHALTIQYDQKNGIYRFIDSNLGVVQYENKEQLEKQLRKYIECVYDHYNIFAVQIVPDSNQT